VVWEWVRWENMERYVDAGIFARVVYDQRRAIPGATRNLHFPAGPPVRERLESVDERQRRYSYSLIDPGPVPVRDYVGEVRIEPDGDDASWIHVASTCTPVGVSEEEWARTYAAMQEGLFTALRRAVAQT
jgi:hypothetical protein